MSDELPSIDGSPTRIVAGVMIHDRVIADGTASSSKYAKLKASSNALESLSGLAPSEFRAHYRCDCSDGKALEEVRTQPLEEAVGSAI